MAINLENEQPGRFFNNRQIMKALVDTEIELLPGQMSTEIMGRVVIELTRGRIRSGLKLVRDPLTSVEMQDACVWNIRKFWDLFIADDAKKPEGKLALRFYRTLGDGPPDEGRFKGPEIEEEFVSLVTAFTILNS